MALFAGAFSKLRKGLTRTREAVAGSVGSVASLFRARSLSEELIDEVESRLIRADLGVAATRRVIDSLRDAYRKGEIKRGEEALEHLKRQLKALWPPADRALSFAPVGPTVILVAGVNGAGKTTSVAKLAKNLRDEGRTVLLAACDTFRAGAVRQLEIWAERIGVDLVRGQQGGDPAAVAFDACAAAISRNVDVLIVDTAGRLHTQDPLMRQLVKIREVVARRIDGAPHEVLLVLDATAGQNAVRQAEEFSRAIGVTGVFLAKLDGTAKGGAAIAVRDAIGAPVKLVGVGESLDDVEPFDPDSFVDAMFADDD